MTTQPERFQDVFNKAIPDEYDEFLAVLDDYGWRKLGSELGFTARELDRFEKKSSPSREMMTTWMPKEQATLLKLQQSLTKIDHYTARRQLDKVVGKN